MREPCYDIYTGDAPMPFAPRLMRCWYFGYAQVVVDRLRAEGQAVRCIINRGPGTLHTEVLLPREQFKE